MTQSYDLPMPGEVFDGAYVIASTWFRDDEEPIQGTVVLLRPDAPFYQGREIEYQRGGWVTTYREDFPNIVPAVRWYEENGGDY